MQTGRPQWGKGRNEGSLTTGLCEVGCMFVGRPWGAPEAACGGREVAHYER